MFSVIRVVWLKLSSTLWSHLSQLSTLFLELSEINRETREGKMKGVCCFCNWVLFTFSFSLSHQFIDSVFRKSETMKWEKIKLWVVCCCCNWVIFPFSLSLFHFHFLTFTFSPICRLCFLELSEVMKIKWWKVCCCCCF